MAANKHTQKGITERQHPSALALVWVYSNREVGFFPSKGESHSTNSPEEE